MTTPREQSPSSSWQGDSRLIQPGGRSYSRIAWKAVNSEGSDQISFAEAHVPVVSLFTGYHADYHRAGDVVSRINFDGLGTVVDLTERVIRAIADGDTRPGDKSH